MTLSKCLKLPMILLFVLILCTACQSHKEPGTSGYISLNELESLVDKGAALNWSDFDKYPYEDIGSGVYIRKYEIEGEGQLLVRGKVWKIRLSKFLLWIKRVRSRMCCYVLIRYDSCGVEPGWSIFMT